MLEKALNTKESRQITKLFKTIRKFKKHLKSHHFVKILEFFFPEKNFGFLKDSQDFNPEFTDSFDFSRNSAAKFAKIPEIALFIQSLLLIYLVQIRKLDIVIYIHLIFY